jgi:acyl-CoA reductase-like NAD-dependent aldehyde dehydrogenase
VRAGKGAFEAKELAASIDSQQIPEHNTPVKAIDKALAVLAAHKDAWVALGIPERIAILEGITRGIIRVAQRWVTISLESKDTLANPIGEAEEWVFFATTVRALRVLRESLIDIRRYGRPRISGRVTIHSNGQAVAEVFPRNRIEKLIFRGITGEVWMEPGVTAQETIRTQALVYRDKNHKGKVALVLGAGNASPISVVDLLHKLFIEDQVAVLKPNPVNAYLGPLIEEGFHTLIARGFLRVIYGGTEAGSYLCSHPAVDEIHMTGSDKTFEAIIFGQGTEGVKRKSDRKPLITKRFTCELGNVSPVIIVPGPWREDDIQHQAEHLATWVTANAGFGCLTPRVVIQHESWANRKAFVEAVGHVLEQVETRKAYYPGAKERHAAFVAEHPEACQFGDASGGRLPWTFITDVDPDNSDDICFRREAFCSLFAETALKATSIVDYIERAVEFANNTLWGTLNATVIVHPHSLADPLVAAAIEHAIENLRYGTVLINLLAYYSYHFMVTPWGAFPGHSIYDIQSGTGKTANMLMFEQPQKSVARAPFRKPLDPVIVTSKRAKDFAREMTYFEAAPTLWKLPGLFWTALRS